VRVRATRAPAALLALAVLTGCGGGPVELDGAAPPQSARERCRAFLDGLPATLADQPRREVNPEDGWGAAYGDPPIVVRCGVPIPATYDETAVCTNVNGVDWFIPMEQLEADDPGSYTMTTVNRTPRVEAVLPVDYFPPATAMADLTAPVDAHLQPSTSGCG
jgi:predicted small lipoprotein YifL